MEEGDIGSLLVRGASIITMAASEGASHFHPRADILIRDDRVEAIAPRVDSPADEVIDADGLVALPGLINGHNHFEQSFMNGLVRLFPGSTPTWINEFKIPITRCMSADDYRLSALLTSLHMIRSGVTTSVNHVCQQPVESLLAFGIESFARAADEAGVRVVMPIGLAGYGEPDDYLVDAPTYDSYLRGWHDRWNETASGRLRIWAGPTGFWCTTPEMWKLVKEFADQRGCGIHTHFASFQRGDVARSVEVGVLGDNFVGAHSVWMDDSDVRTVAHHGAKIAHNPTYKLGYALDSDVREYGDGIAPIAEMHAHGVTVCLGQDGCMGDTQDLFKEMRMLAFTQHYRYRDKRLYPPSKLLEMVTIDGARCLLWDDEIGSLEEGKKADITLLDTRTANFVPRHNVLAGIVYQATPADVKTVIVNGDVLMRDGRVLALDEDRLLAEAHDAASDLIERAGLGELRRLSLDPWLSSARVPE